MRIKPLLLAGVVFLAACATPASDPRPARIVEPSDASQAALQRVVDRALGLEVMVSDEALTDSSTLVLERAARRNPSRHQGRDLEEPERFFLLRHNGDCLLEHERTGERYPLPDTRCEPE